LPTIAHRRPTPPPLLSITQIARARRRVADPYPGNGNLPNGRPPPSDQQPSSSPAPLLSRAIEKVQMLALAFTDRRPVCCHGMASTKRLKSYTSESL